VRREASVIRAAWHLARVLGEMRPPSTRATLGALMLRDEFGVIYALCVDYEHYIYCVGDPRSIYELATQYFKEIGREKVVLLPKKGRWSEYGEAKKKFVFADLNLLRLGRYRYT